MIYTVVSKCFVCLIYECLLFILYHISNRLDANQIIESDFECLVFMIKHSLRDKHVNIRSMVLICFFVNRANKNKTTQTICLYD